MCSLFKIVAVRENRASSFNDGSDSGVETITPPATPPKLGNQLDYVQRLRKELENNNY
jgi:hypothetical protein